MTTPETKIEKDKLRTTYSQKIEGEWKKHREDGPAVEWLDGDQDWYSNGNLHREDGPAILRACGYNAWYLHGKRHREDGPAVKYGKGGKEWWVNGVKMTQEKFEAKQNPPEIKDTLSPLEKQKKELLTLMREFGYQDAIFAEYAKLLELER